MGGSMEGNPCIDASSRSPVSGEKTRTQFPSLVLKEKFGAPAPTFCVIPRHVIKSGHIITPQGQKMLISRNLLKTMLDFLFCPIQLYKEVNVMDSVKGKLHFTESITCVKINNLMP